MKGDFEQAVNNNEIIAFFKGEGDYFSPNEINWGYHSYIINWQSMMGYLKNKENAFELLVNYFKVYLNSLEDNLPDAWDLFNNIECYYSLIRKNNNFSNNSNDLFGFFDNNEKQKIGRLFRLLRDNFDDIPDAKYDSF